MLSNSVSHCKPFQEDAILSMTFLVDQHYETNFQYPVMTVSGISWPELTERDAP